MSERRMLRWVVGVLNLAIVAAPASLTAQRVGPAAVNEQGQRLYQQQCALCHRDSGVGDPPTVPALSGSDQLRDPVRLVRTIHQGGEGMPPFPYLTVEETTALADYLRNAWANALGGVTTDEVAAVLEGLDEADPLVSAWDGVFTEGQATRGEAVYSGACATCHGRRLNGAPDDPDMRSSPPLARARFLRVWEGRSLATLFEYTRATMPEDNPNSLTGQEYVDVIAYMLSVGGMPVGDGELQSDPLSLARVVIRP